jgi:hypothetical protein
LRLWVRTNARVDTRLLGRYYHPKERFVLTRTIGTIAALLLFAFAAAATPAITIYDSLGIVAEGYSVAASGPLYDSFSTGSSALNLVDVQLELRFQGLAMSRPPAEAPLLLAGYRKPVAEVHSKASSGLRPQAPPPGGGSITVALYADSSTSPGALLTSIGTLPDTSLGPKPGNFNFPLGSPYPLAANHRYWIGVSTSNASLAGWLTTTVATGTGVANEFWYASGTVNSNSDPPFQMLVLGAAVIPTTPAPPSLILVLIGLVGAGLYLTRNKLGFSR